MEELLNAGADPAAQDRLGHTPAWDAEAVEAHKVLQCFATWPLRQTATKLERQSSSAGAGDREDFSAIWNDTRTRPHLFADPVTGVQASSSVPETWFPIDWVQRHLK